MCCQASIPSRDNAFGFSAARLTGLPSRGEKEILIFTDDREHLLGEHMCYKRTIYYRIVLWPRKPRQAHNNDALRPRIVKQSERCARHSTSHAATVPRDVAYPTNEHLGSKTGTYFPAFCH